jgi:hypothetical protein
MTICNQTWGINILDGYNVAITKNSVILQKVKNDCNKNLTVKNILDGYNVAIIKNERR